MGRSSCGSYKHCVLSYSGDIKFLMMDVAEATKQHKDEQQKKYMCMKKLIQTYIPDGEAINGGSLSLLPDLITDSHAIDHNELNQIKDTYKVFVCQRKMYLDPFIQESLLHYNKPCYYSICALGHKVGSI